LIFTALPKLIPKLAKQVSIQAVFSMGYVAWVKACSWHGGLSDVAVATASEGWIDLAIEYHAIVCLAAPEPFNRLIDFAERKFLDHRLDIVSFDEI